MGKLKRIGNEKSPTKVSLIGSSDARRDSVEEFVWSAFNRAYAADIRTLMPVLMVLKGSDQEILGALGLREAENSVLFLEQYLDQPIELLLNRDLPTPSVRARIIEVGNFSVGTPGGGRWLITALTAYLHSINYDWAVFTCVPALKNAFERLGISLIDLAPADPNVLDPQERRRWGSYYQTQPRVMAASVQQSVSALSRQFLSQPILEQLFRRALHTGAIAA